MEQRSGKLVFELDECETFADIAGSYLIHNFEELSERDAFRVHTLRAQAHSRVIAQEHGLFDNEGVMYPERKDALTSLLEKNLDSGDNHTDEAEQEAMLFALAQLPETAEEAMSFTVEDTVLVRNCIRWAKTEMLSGKESVEDFLREWQQREASEPTSVSQQKLAELRSAINRTGMYATLWAIELGEDVPESL